MAPYFRSFKKGTPQLTSCKKIADSGGPKLGAPTAKTGTARMRSHPQSERTFGSNWWGLLRPKRGEERWETNGRRLSWELVGKEVHVQMYFIAQSWDWFTRLFIFSFIIFFCIYSLVPNLTVEHFWARFGICVHETSWFSCNLKRKGGKTLA